MRDVDIARIRQASSAIDPVFLDTPVVRQASLDEALGCALFAKVETLNPIRSFKGRGTEYFAATDVTPGDALVCASAGNFGQGLARAATKRGLTCTVFAATGANRLKIEAMRRLGADVRLDGKDFDAAKDAARAFAGQTGARFVEDGAIASIAEGAGSIGLELAVQVAELDDVVVPLGNGALLAGVGEALRHMAPKTRIVAVVAEAAPAMKLSLESGAACETPTAATIADGIAVRVPVPEALVQLRGRWDEIVAVGEADIVEGMRLAHAHLGLVVEPAGAAGLAAVAANRARFAGRRVGTILCGGNVTREQAAAWLLG
jgi:threonine dehydratase